MVAALAIVLGAGSCAVGDQEDPSVATGALSLQVAGVPADVLCLELRVTSGQRTVRRFIDVISTDALTVTEEGLPLGPVSVTAAAYGSICFLAGPDSTPTWVGTPVTAALLPSRPVRVMINMSRPGSSIVTVVFDDAGAPGGGGAGGSGGQGGGGAGGTPGTDPPPGVTKPVGATGGELELDGGEIAIPAGALPGMTNIQMQSAVPPAKLEALSKIYEFGPAGLTFAKPVTVRLGLLMSLEPEAPPPVVFWSRPDGTFEALESWVEGDSVVAKTTHFSKGYVADECRPTPDCTCNFPEPDGRELCLKEPKKIREAACTCRASDGGVLCKKGSPTDCAQAYTNIKEGEACSGVDSAGKEVSGTAKDCVPERWECEKTTFRSTDGIPCNSDKSAEKPAGMWIIGLWGEGLDKIEGARAKAARARCPGSSVRTEQSCWAQINGLNCRMNKGRTGVECSGNGDCEPGDFCDKASVCGCCTKPYPAPLDKPVERNEPAKCEVSPEGKPRCALPWTDRYDCVRHADDPTIVDCEIKKDDPIWFFEAGATPDQLGSAFMWACVVPKPEHKCNWKLTFNLMGEKIKPLTDIARGYECGGTNCNGLAEWQLTRVPGRKYMMRLVHDECSPPQGP